MKATPLPASLSKSDVSTMFRVKICGITNPTDAEAAVAAGADAIGLNFYSGSSRCIDRAKARSIVAVVGDRACKVGVFVDAATDEIVATCDELKLDLVQLHGDERPDVLRPLAPRPVMKAFRLGPDGLAPVRAWLEECVRISLFPKLVLLDGFHPGRFGGTGQVADWTMAAAYAATPGVPPLVLAGGLTAENVAEAIRAVRPAAVDAAGGVESSPGHKDAEKMRAFVAAARQALG
jgi:phosphoribosylanthranilate isomerase